ncbi:hypothetical protein D3C81_07530 [compost metagenome]
MLINIIQCCFHSIYVDTSDLSLKVFSDMNLVGYYYTDMLGAGKILEEHNDLPLVDTYNEYDKSITKGTMKDGELKTILNVVLSKLGYDTTDNPLFIIREKLISKEIGVNQQLLKS